MEILESVIRMETPLYKLVYIFSTAVIWYALFYVVLKFVPLQKFEPKMAASIKQKYVALIYDMIVLWGPTLIYMRRGLDPVLVDPWIDKVILYESCGYYIAHMILVIRLKITNSAQITHHILTILAIMGTVAFNFAAQLACLWLYIYQLSHLPLHGRALLKDFGKVYTKAYEYIESLYFGIYLFERCIAGTWLTYQCYFVINVPNVIVTILASLTWVQSLYFCFHMFKMLPKKIRKMKERELKQIKYFWIEDNPEVKLLSYYRKEEKEKIL